MPRKIEISHKTIIFTVLFLGSMWFLYFISDIVLQLFVAILLVTILNPFVTKLSKYKIPKIISILLSYVLIFAFLGIAIASILPPLIEQTTNLVNGLPSYFQNSELSKYINEDIAKQFISQLGSFPEQILKAGFSIFGNILSIFTVAVFAFYLLLVRDKLEDRIRISYSEKIKQEKYHYLINTLEVKLGGWARGQFGLMLSIGILTYIGFSVSWYYHILCLLQ